MGTCFTYSAAQQASHNRQLWQKDDQLTGTIQAWGHGESHLHHDRRRPSTPLDLVSGTCADRRHLREQGHAELQFR